MGKRFFRSIRTRVIVTMAGMFVLMLIVVAVILNTLMSSNINSMESQFVCEHVFRAVNALQVELSDLKKITGDWAIWTDTYQFVADGNQQYIESNLGESSLQNLRLDMMAFVDLSNKYVYAKEYSNESGQLETLTAQECSILKTSIDPDNETKQGLLRMPKGVMLVATSPILPNSGEGQANGTFLIGRYLNETEVAYLSQISSLQITIDQTLQGDDIPYSPETGISYENLIVDVHEINAHTIQGTTMVYDMSGARAAIVGIQMDRSIKMLAHTGSQSVIFVLLGFALIFIFLIFLFTHRVIVSRVLAMSSTIQAIRGHDDLSQRLLADGYRDELSGMTMAVNRMLDNIQESQRQLEDRENQISFQANHDSLTGLPNRLHFAEHITHAVQKAKESGRLLAILFLDLDGFKMINDSLGHVTGDLLLMEVAERLRATLRAGDSIARLGGDEFVILLENIDDIAAIHPFATKILQCFREPFVLNHQECFISTSIGVAAYPADGEDGEALLKNADIAMYRAKEKGKNQYVLCSADIKNRIREAMRISNHLFRALERKEFELYYQPQIDCSTNRIVGVEALIRWHHPERGMVMPAEFISIAEQTGSILTIGEWVLRTACAQAQAWHDAGYPRLRIGVNLSIRQFQNHNIVSEVCEILTDTGFDPAYLELEITESIAMREKEYVLEALGSLRGMGIRISIDDFGTEYSSMSHLKQLPVDRIKIPMSFVHGIDLGSKDKAITKSIIVLAKSLGLSVIAEGVETQTQLAFLSQKMCDEVQGFYFHKPMASRDLEKLLVQQMAAETYLPANME